MKQVKFMLIAMFAMTVQGVVAQSNRVVRHHNGEVTIFKASQLQAAIDACEEGDTIALGKGSYSGFSITKTPITVIGNGVANTIINGAVSLGASGDTLVFKNRTLEGLKITGDVNLYKADNIRMRKCYFPAYFSVFNNIKQKIEFENCDVNELPNLDNVTAVNTLTGTLKYPICNGYLLNCFIVYNNNYYTYGGRNYEGSAENCVLYNSYSKITTGSWVNCLFPRPSSWVSENVISNCYFNAELKEKDYLDDVWKELTYMGTDGTMVGHYGGIAPYSLEMLNPITSVNLKVDAINQKLNVTVKMADK